MATSINNVRTMDNPQRSYEFEVEIFGSAFSGSIPLLTQRVESVTMPSTSVDVIEVNFKGRKTIYAGRDASSHMTTVSFYDDEKREMYKYFKNWMDGALNDQITGAALTRDLYAGEMLIKTFAHDSNTVTGITKLTKVFPTEVSDVTLSYEASDHFRFDVTFAFDTNEIVQ